MSSLFPSRVQAAILGFMAAGLGACVAPPDPPDTTAAPALVLESFFPGRTVGGGVFTNAWTGAERRFSVVIDGSWDGATLTLVEDFAFADGETDRKTWRFERTGPGTYVGSREDVVGLARAWTDGKVVRLEYAVMLGGWTVDFADVLALTDRQSLVNRATVGKWGIRVGRVELHLRHADGT
jgi:hypothetical protein